MSNLSITARNNHHPSTSKGLTMTTAIAITIYAMAMTLANLCVAAYGPNVTGITAFVLIGLDLALRDWLHFRLKAWQMAALISSTGLITYLLNPGAGQIAVASAVAFTAAALVDWGTFSKLRGGWFIRANGSNLAGAAVDSIIFPTIAFGVLLPQVVLVQFLAKVSGGAVWTWLISRTQVQLTK